jgi:hypothetical protein
MAMKNFRVGRHQVRVWVLKDRWRVAVDDAQLPDWHVRQADAWAAGVREADRLDRAAA